MTDLEILTEINIQKVDYKLDENEKITRISFIACEIHCVKMLVEKLKLFKNLKHLDLSQNEIFDISALQELTNLTSLDLSKNYISDISALRELKNLKFLLDLSDNFISNIENLRNLENLTNLDVSKNEVSNVSVLQNLKNLEILILNENQIVDISVLRELKNLNELYLSNNQIADISALCEMKNIKYLYLQKNCLKIFPEFLLDFEANIYWKPAAHKNGIFLENNNFENIPVNVILKGKNQIRKFFSQKKLLIFKNL